MPHDIDEGRWPQKEFEPTPPPKPQTYALHLAGGACVEFTCEQLHNTREGGLAFITDGTVGAAVAPGSWLYWRRVDG